MSASLEPGDEVKRFWWPEYPPLALQNHILLLKFVHKIHEPATIPKKTWFLSQNPGGLKT